MATKQAPAAGSKASLPELTLRGIIIGGLITLILTAANVYLGLKVGLTFATSIPAAVISMAVLRRFSGHNIKENNIVQTIASAAGTLSAIIFVLPGLVMVGYWQGFGFESSDKLLPCLQQCNILDCVSNEHGEHLSMGTMAGNLQTAASNISRTPSPFSIVVSLARHYTSQG